jgi:hypothetical protein
MKKWLVIAAFACAAVVAGVAVAVNQNYNTHLTGDNEVPANLSMGQAAIEAGDAYVNVHTNDGVAPTNTGPGDFPGGEIRGQLP